MRSLHGIVAVVLLWAGAAYAQDATGIWQGTLQDGPRQLRVVFTISSEGGALKAVGRSIDQGGQPIGVTSVTRQGTTLKMAISTLNVTFEGKLSLDGKTIAGVWTQGTGTQPLMLERATPDTAWALPALPAMMAANAPTTFEVATIKPSRPDTQGKGFFVRGREVTTVNTSLIDLISFAYQVHPKQIVGSAPWLDADKYDVTGRPDAPGVPNPQQLRMLVQSLLADRFGLVFHREKRELSVYAITVLKTGAQVTRSEGDPNGLGSMVFRGLGNLPVVNSSMADFASVMQSAVLDRPVVDQTGLSGRFDFTLKWTPEENQFGGLGIRVPPPTNDPNAPPGLFTAIQEQLGLKLDAVKAPADVLVIDKVEKPSPN
jgi:uncharacterized protein (TIGR03435 family)